MVAAAIMQVMVNNIGIFLKSYSFKNRQLVKHFRLPVGA